jgi:cell division protein FtsQ
MDGERRVVEPVKNRTRLKPDCKRSYRIAARTLSVLFVGAALFHGIVSGGHLNYPGSPWPKLPGKLAAIAGFAALDIKITGLQHHEPQTVLSHIGVKPGGGMFGFDAHTAEKKLEALDWVEAATVIRRFPNQLDVAVIEREPFVVWQHDGKLSVIDRKGKVMGGVSAQSTNVLLHVVGEGANLAASDLLNQMEATPGLRHQAKAVVRVGDRRWDVHMDNGIVLALPEAGLPAALRLAEATFLTASSQKLPVQHIDFRIPGEITYRALDAAVLPAHDVTTTSSIQ